MAKFSHYAIAAARQAISDSNWKPETDLEKQRTVRISKLVVTIY
jgi:3-oxoacyl-[acyl-carrier-protein] synthase II